MGGVEQALQEVTPATKSNYTLDEWLSEHLCEGCPAHEALRTAIINAVESEHPVRQKAGQYAIKGIYPPLCKGIPNMPEGMATDRHDMQKVRPCGSLAVAGVLYFLHETENLGTPSLEA